MKKWNPEIKEGIEHYPKFKIDKDRDLNIEYIYSNPEKAEH